jgi:hypothetical protein
LVQAEGNVAIYDNVLRNRFGPGIHIQPHNDVPRAVRIVFNTVITTGDPIAVRLPEGPQAYEQIIAGNAVFSPRPIAGGTQHDNMTFGYEEAGRMLASNGQDGAPFDPYPAAGKLRCGPLEARLLEPLVDAACDFNGRRRAEPYCGAYAGSGRNPGWLPALTLKPRTACAAR